jgi:hypothetical protein
LPQIFFHKKTDQANKKEELLGFLVCVVIEVFEFLAVFSNKIVVDVPVEQRRDVSHVDQLEV